MSASCTDLGSTDITLMRASPAHLQPLIAANPWTTFVLLHASYPYMRKGDYLTASYGDVYFDISGVFPAESVGGQEAPNSLIRQVRLIRSCGQDRQVSYSWLHTGCGVETLRAAFAHTCDG